jgi:hypothetical protein
VCSNKTCTGQCASGTVDCAGACCLGNVCCGGGTICQTVHSDGLGQTYLDCNPPGQPGKAATYSQTMALEAAAAFSSMTPITTQTCIDPNGQNAQVVIVQSNDQTTFATWQYTQSLAGFVNNQSAPTCPDGSSPKWT